MSSVKVASLRAIVQTKQMNRELLLKETLETDSEPKAQICA